MPDWFQSLAPWAQAAVTLVTIAGLLLVAVIIDLALWRWAQVEADVAGIPVRMRCGSYVNWFTGTDATVLFGVIHVRYGKHTGSLEWLAAEVGHCFQWQRDGVLGFLVRMVRDFRGMEAEAHGPLAEGLLRGYRADLVRLQTAFQGRYDGTRTLGGG